MCGMIDSRRLKKSWTRSTLSKNQQKQLLTQHFLFLLLLYVTRMSKLTLQISVKMCLKCHNLLMLLSLKLHLLRVRNKLKRNVIIRLKKTRQTKLKRCLKPRKCVKRKPQSTGSLSLHALILRMTTTPKECARTATILKAATRLHLTVNTLHKVGKCTLKECAKLVTWDSTTLPN